MAETRQLVRRLAVVVSGAGRVRLDEVTSAFARVAENAEIDVHVAHSSAEATAVAREAARSASIVVAVGGDGTVADIATGIFGSPAALGIVPAGSTNIVARSLGIPVRPAAAIALFGGLYQVRAIDVGRSDDRSFLHIAGAGFDAQLFAAANTVWKRRLGWIAYLPAAVAALRLPLSDVIVTADGVAIETLSSLVLVANGGSAILPEFRIYPGIAVDDGWLDILVFTPATAGEIAATLSAVGRQRLDRSPHVIHRRARTVRIEAEPPLPVELDGDLRGTTPRQFEIEPLGLRVVIPRPGSRDEFR